MATEGEPTDLIKVLHLLVLSFSWGMQVWVSFISGISHEQIHGRDIRLRSSRVDTCVTFLVICVCSFCTGPSSNHSHLWPGAE